mmetsp:Transcript_60678/g.121518  ORF Transcript_60678/g.121518 Transcript_60678/m.121518 type:complete len:325 (-) Transcript_60678:8-982(-)
MRATCRRSTACPHQFSERVRSAGPSTAPLPGHAHHLAIHVRPGLRLRSHRGRERAEGPCASSAHRVRPRIPVAHETRRMAELEGPGDWVRRPEPGKRDHPDTARGWVRVRRTQQLAQRRGAGGGSGLPASRPGQAADVPAKLRVRRVRRDGPAREKVRRRVRAQHLEPHAALPAPHVARARIRGVGSHGRGHRLVVSPRLPNRPLRRGNEHAHGVGVSRGDHLLCGGRGGRGPSGRPDPLLRPDAARAVRHVLRRGARLGGLSLGLLRAGVRSLAPVLGTCTRLGRDGVFSPPVLHRCYVGGSVSLLCCSSWQIGSPPGVGRPI